MASILLTGATGFIGHHLRIALEKKGHDVTSFVRPRSDRIEPSYKHMLGDITDYDRVLGIVEKVKPEVVFHLASLTPVRKSFEQPLLYYQVNVGGTINLIHACLKTLGNEFRYIGASTAEVYGDNGEIVKREGQRLMPASPYGNTKVAADKHTQMCGLAYGLDYVLLRANNTYGRPRSGYFVEVMMEKLIANKVCDLYNPFHFRDYMWYEDHVNAYLLVLDKGYGVYNVSPGNPITNIGMVRLMKKVIHSKSEVVIVPPPASRPIDHKGINMDASLIRNLGWKLVCHRKEGIRRLRAMYVTLPISEIKEG